MYKLCLLLFALGMFSISASAQVCNETAPCQQLACMQVQVYCINCGGNPECDVTGYSCDQYTVWSDWWFGTTCDEQVSKNCVYGSCGPGVQTFNASKFKSVPQGTQLKGNHAKAILAVIRARNRQRAS